MLVQKLSSDGQEGCSSQARHRGEKRPCGDAEVAQRAKAKFDEIDMNGNGTLEGDELNALAVGLGELPSWR